ncbi:MAG: N-acetylmuramoyl-L-alanine amidase [Clostridia bacterium]|nr:N-acetylmuramoyl-L-alanine amidase [Clostridia bacterium]
MPPNGKTIFVDPGHGFRDPGAGAENYELGEGRDESWVTLAVSKLLGEKLEALGYTVLFTHQNESTPDIEQYLTDNYFDPNERVALVNSKMCDYFISLHCNIFDDPEVDGTKLYIFDNPIKTNHDSEQIALLIADKIDSAFPDARKCTLDTQSLAVIREVTVASCLIEMGFVSNPSDAAKLVDPEWQSTFAEAVAAGINAYFFPSESDAPDTAETEPSPEN